MLLQSIVRNQTLIDGNKRLGRLAATVTYAFNGVRLEAPFDDAYDLVIAVATGSMTHQHSAAMLATWTSTST